MSSSFRNKITQVALYIIEYTLSTFEKEDSTDIPERTIIDIAFATDDFEFFA